MAYRPPGHGVFHPGGVVPPMGLPPHPGVFPGQQVNVHVYF